MASVNEPPCGKDLRLSREGQGAFSPVAGPRGMHWCIQPEEVRVEGLSSIKAGELLYLLGIEPGHDMRADALREGIKRAFVKGIFESISVETDESHEGLLWIKVREKDYIQEVEIEGNRLLRGKFLMKRLGRLGLKKGKPLRHEKLDAIRGELLEDILRKGFPSAAVTFDIRRTDEPYRVRLVVNIVEGGPVPIREIEISGWPYKDIRPLMRLKEGDVYDRFSLEEDMEKIKEHYVELGHMNPSVGPYSFKDGVLRISVSLGKRLSMAIKGNDNIRTRKLLGMVSFYDAGDIRDDMVEEAVTRMLSLYNDNGYPYAQIAPVISRQDNDINLTFYVYEGRKVLVESVRFQGISIPERNLKAIMTQKERAGFNLKALRSDMDIVREFYIALGHINVYISEPKVDISDSWARIEIEVEEGESVRLSDIRIEGFETIPEDRLYGTLDVRAGEPYNEVDISDSRRKLLNLCRSYGYLDCAVDVAREVDGAAADLVFTIKEGRKMYFGKTVIAGNRSTELRVIDREFMYRAGEPFDSSLLAGTRRRLYKLNLFSSVNAEILNRNDQTVDVVMDVRESMAGNVEFGLGYGQYEEYRGFMDISYANLFGMNRKVSFRTEQSSIASRYILNYQEPWLFGRNVQSRTFLMWEERKEKNIDTGDIWYRVRRYSASTGIEKKVSERTKASLYYEFSLVKTYDLLPDVVKVLSREDTGTLAISGFSPSLMYDSRDDPFDPQRGVFAGITMKLASAEFMSETDFLKTTVHGSGYYRLFRWLVVAASLKGGGAGGFADTHELPLVERFFLGGRNTVRGFDQDGLGPKGSGGVPTGGNAFVLGNLELRTRIAGWWRIVAFLDSGNVWAKSNEVDLEDLRYTSGMGMQYNTPVGPLRLDYGYKLDREPDESKGELHFSIGHAF
jgi:outer membrane protein insertion porin family